MSCNHEICEDCKESTKDTTTEVDFAKNDDHRPQDEKKCKQARLDPPTRPTLAKVVKDTIVICDGSPEPTSAPSQKATCTPPQQQACPPPPPRAPIKPVHSATV